MKFKVGDRVKVVNTLGHGAKVGMTGEIVEIIGDIYGVRLDEWFGDGHDMYGKCEQGHGQWMTGENLELVCDNHKIVITSDGKTTLARLYEGKEVVKSAEANCTLDDEFDFTKGAKIAFEGLIGAEEYDYHKAFITLHDYCISCYECKIEKLAKSKGMLSCPDLISFADIEHKRYSPEYLDNLIAELESFDKTDKPKYKEVHRQAKAGEYVRLDAEYGAGTGGYGKGEFDRCGIYKVETVDGLAFIRSKTNNLRSFFACEYVVLEGYKPEVEAERATEKPEEKPKYYSGKVVCVNNYKLDNHLTVGKVYVFVDGNGINDAGSNILRTSAKTFDEINNRFSAKMFIELKE